MVVQDLIRAGGDLTIADRGGMLPADYAEGMKERERRREREKEKKLILTEAQPIIPSSP
jgi:hypothetical protein